MGLPGLPPGSIKVVTTHKPVHGVSSCGRPLPIKTSPLVSKTEACGRGGRTVPSLIQT